MYIVYCNYIMIDYIDILLIIFDNIVIIKIYEKLKPDNKCH